VRRIVLNEPNVERALAAMRSLPHMAGRSYLLGDATGDIAGVEVSAGRGVRVNQRVAPVLHTNHALDPDIRDDEDEDALMKTYPSSRHRLQVLQRVATGLSSVGDLIVALGNRRVSQTRYARADLTPNRPRRHSRSSLIVEATRCTSAPAHRQSAHIVRSCCRPKQLAPADPPACARGCVKPMTCISCRLRPPHERPLSLRVGGKKARRGITEQ